MDDNEPDDYGENAYLVGSDQLGELSSLPDDASLDTSTGYCMLAYEEISPSNTLNGDEKEEWLEAIKEEMCGLQRNEVFGYGLCPEGIKPLDTHYVLSKKKNIDGTTRYKARLVVKGYNQRYGVDYFETFFPVIKFDSFRAVLALTATRKWDTITLDFTQAYLNAPIE